MQRTGRPSDHGIIAALSGRDRQRLLERVAQLGDLADLMRQPGSLAEAPEPPPLHRTNHDATTERTTTL